MIATLNPAERVAVLVIDLQNKYTDPSSRLRLDDADELIERIADFVERARPHGARVVWVNRRSRPEVGPGRRTTKLFGSKLGSFQNEAMDAQDSRLVPKSPDIVIEKRRHSAFYETDLESTLRNWGAQTVILAGVTSNVCVAATAFDAVARDLDVVIAEDLTASLPVLKDGQQVMSAHEVQAATMNLLGYAVGDVSDGRSILNEWDTAQPTG